MVFRSTVALATLLLAIPASASIAVFSDGRNMKVESFRAVDGETMHLVLANGGSMSVPLHRIERIVDDEIAPPEVVAEVKKIVEAEGVFPKRSWRYSASSAPIFKSKYNEIIVAAAKHWDVDAALVSAVIKAESDYDNKTVSHKGARGLMQLMPATARRFGVSDSHDPQENIFAGVRYLRWLLNTFDGNADLAVAAYNAGEGNVWKYKGVPPFRETITYINRIAKHLRRAEASVVTASVTAGAAR